VHLSNDLGGDDFLDNDLFSHDVFDVGETFELLHEASALFLKGAEVLDLLSKSRDSVHSESFDSVAFLSQVADGFLSVMQIGVQVSVLGFPSADLLIIDLQDTAGLLDLEFEVFDFGVALFELVVKVVPLSSDLLDGLEVDVDGSFKVMAFVFPLADGLLLFFDGGF